ncbi:MAG: hypothetical protein EXS08_01190 [Planctomycetes bacterium]|nr:hypothetical protein [Planctomycetota bacterium]
MFRLPCFATFMGVFTLLGLALPPVPTCPAWKATGGASGARFGASLAAWGDVNGDGFDDLIVGAPNSGGGRAYVYAGSALGLSSVPPWVVESPEFRAAFASSVSSAGDVNGDGYDDVLVGAPYHDGDLPIEGSASLFLGGASGLATLPIWIAGPLLAGITGVHDRVKGDISPQLIPAQPALVGLPWAAQYVVIGGGHADLSQAAFGIFASCP